MVQSFGFASTEIRDYSGAAELSLNRSPVMDLAKRLIPPLFVVLWATGFIGARYAMPWSEPFTFLAARFAIAFALLGIVLLAWRSRPASLADAMHGVIAGMLMHGIYLGGLWWAIAEGVPAGMAGIIAALQPLMTAMAAPFLVGERLQPVQRLGLLLGFIGIAIAISPKLLTPETANLWQAVVPLAVNLLAMASVTYGTLYQKRYLQTGDLRTIATLQYVGALIVTVPLAFIFEGLHFDGTQTAILSLLWSVFGLSMGGVGLLLYLIRRGQVSRAASLIYLMPPAVAIEAAIAFGEPLTLPIIMGTAVVVIGVYLTNRRTADVVPE